MRVFQEIGARVRSRWQARHFDEAAFADIATEALAAFPPSELVGPYEVVEWAQSQTTLPTQVGDGSFGQPPLTVFADTRFYIEVLYWLDGTTSIHQHAFGGAFHVLAGSSIHARYDFDAAQRINARCAFGSVKLSGVEYLRAGDTRPIVHGSDFIHSLFHLDHPSVSVVVRTYKDLDAGPTYSYWKPCLAMVPAPLNEATRRKLVGLHMMREIGHPKADGLFADLVARADLEEAITILQDLFVRITDWDRLCRLVEVVGDTHGIASRDLVSVFSEQRRQQKIISRRRHTRSPEHRFFLALLLNVPSKQPLFEFVRRRFPDHDPAKAILQWVTEMTKPTSEHGSENALGIPLNDGALTIFGGLLEGLSREQLKARLLEEFDPADVETLAPEIDAMSAALKSSEIFRPLFTG